jgi:hypothetical protein
MNWKTRCSNSDFETFYQRYYKLNRGLGAPTACFGKTKKASECGAKLVDLLTTDNHSAMRLSGLVSVGFAQNTSTSLSGSGSGQVSTTTTTTSPTTPSSRIVSSNKTNFIQTSQTTNQYIENSKNPEAKSAYTSTQSSAASTNSPPEPQVDGSTSTSVSQDNKSDFLIIEPAKSSSSRYLSSIFMVLVALLIFF